MQRSLTALMFVTVAAPAAIVYSAMLGLGLHRHAPAWTISLAATALVFGPALGAAAVARRNRAPVFAGFLGAWALALFLALPVYFPGERAQAVATGLSLVTGSERVARAVADNLPTEPAVSEPEVPQASAIVDRVVSAPPPLEDHQISLPYEGEGRRLSVQVAFENGGNTVEATMMLDTGATYTTLPLSVLAALGARPADTDPKVVLQTANGEREAHIMLLDRVWLGDLPVDNVAIATCEPCASEGSSGLLGLNVVGGYNLFIDADRREVVFSARDESNRRLDVSPFLDLSASFSRYPGGRVEVDVVFQNTGTRDVGYVAANVRCGQQHWLLDVQRVPAGGRETVRRRLPPHADCPRYQVSLHSGTW